MSNSHPQRGSTLIGFIIGLLVGLAVALVVAIYVTKVPVSFLNKGASRSAEQDAAEEQKNKDWDPNAPLYGKSKSSDKGDAKTEDKPADKAADKAPERKPDMASKVDPKSSDPIADLMRMKSDAPKPADKPAETKLVETKAPANADPFVYFVQAGAYRSAEEAEAQRAKTALLGLDPKISERDQGGRTVYRVRMGPMDKEAAERVRGKLEAAHIDSAMVRVQR